MATKKDLVEAYSFSRRRLVTAFVSGAPGGREVEPSRPGRTVIGGLALGVLLLAGAAITGVFKPHSSFAEDKPALVTNSHGALYVNLGNEGDGHALLHPVVNATSAQLILGDVGLTKVPDDDLAGMDKGGPLGILDAPATVPGAAQLIQSGWSACTGTHLGVRAAISPDALTTSSTGAFLVHDKAGYHVIATGPRGQAYAYDVHLTGVLHSGLRLPPDAVEVPAGWTALFPQGAPLDRSGLGIDGLGERAKHSSAGKKVKIGDYFLSNGVVEVVTQDGYSQASPFAALVLKANGGHDLHHPPAGAWDSVDNVGSPDWPVALPQGSATTPSQVCAVLHDNGDGTTAVRTGVDPTDDASAVTVKTGVEPVVAAGYGAVVHSSAKDPATDPAQSAGAVDTSGTTYLVDDRGYAYRIATPTDVSNLGYADLAPVVVPPRWIGLFRPGVELSRDAALCPPTSDPKAPACS